MSQNQKLFSLKHQLDRIYSDSDIKRLYHFVRIIYEDSIQALKVTEDLIDNSCMSIESLLKKNTQSFKQIRGNLGINENINLNDELLLELQNRVQLIEHYEWKYNQERFQNLMKQAKDFIKQNFNYEIKQQEPKFNNNKNEVTINLANQQSVLNKQQEFNSNYNNDQNSEITNHNNYYDKQQAPNIDNNSKQNSEIIYNQQEQQINKNKNDNNNKLYEYKKNSMDNNQNFNIVNKQIEQKTNQNNINQISDRTIKQQETIVNSNNIVQIQINKELNLSLIKLDIQNDGDSQFKYQSRQMNNSEYKNIIFIGERGEGKTTLLNAFLNYYFEIKWDDKVRLIVADQIQTDDIQDYYIEPYQRQYGLHLIDTPGNYGKDDQQTVDKVSQFIQNNISTIDKIVICIKANQQRLTVETKQMLQSIVNIIGIHNIQKVKVARTFYSGAGGDLDQSIFTDQDSPFNTLSNQLSNNWHLEFNVSSVVKIINNLRAKPLFELSMQNFKYFENERLQNLQTDLVIQNQIANNPKVQDYSQIFLDSYNQLKLLFMQNINAYYWNIRIKPNNTNNISSLDKVKSLKKTIKNIQTFAINCNKCLITCFIDFKTEYEAKSFMNNKQKGISYCGCSLDNNLQIMKEQWSYYQLENYQSQCDFQKSQQTLKNNCTQLYSYLFNLYKIRIPNATQNGQQVMTELQQELKDNQLLLAQYQKEFLSYQSPQSQLNKHAIINQQQLQQFIPIQAQVLTQNK